MIDDPAEWRLHKPASEFFDDMADSEIAKLRDELQRSSWLTRVEAKALRLMPKRLRIYDATGIDSSRMDAKERRRAEYAIKHGKPVKDRDARPRDWATVREALRPLIDQGILPDRGPTRTEAYGGPEAFWTNRMHELRRALDPARAERRDEWIALAFKSAFVPQSFTADDRRRLDELSRVSREEYQRTKGES